MCTKYLAQAESGAKWLADPQVAKLMAESMHFRDGKVYELIAYCIMPNHVHIVFTPLPVAQAASLCANGTQANSLCYSSLASIMHSLKGRTAREGNRLLCREGAFWEHESYDHYVRDEDELERIIRYVLDNPVKAGLVSDWKSWPWAYCRVEPWHELPACAIPAASMTRKP